MQKQKVIFLRHSVLIHILCFCLFIACKDPENNTNPDPVNPSGGTWVEFENLEQYPVTIYNDPGRNVVITEVAANGKNKVLADPAPTGKAFYPTFDLIYPIEKTNGITIPYNGQPVVVNIEANKSNLAKIPKLESIELNSAYIMLINKSDYSLTLAQGGNEKSPMNGGSTIINSGQNAAYEIFSGPVSNYSVFRNTTTPIAFPAEFAEFKRGIIYVITYNGTNLALTDQMSVLQTLPPAVPVNVRTEVLSKNSVKISWNEVFGATSYRVYRAMGSPDASYSQVGNPAASSWTDTGLQAGEIYYYKVSTVSGGNMESGQSTAVIAITPTGDIWVDAVTVSSVSLAWSAVSGAESYNVYRCDSENGTYAKINSDTITDPGFTDTGLGTYTTYYYKVSATSNGIEGEFSDIFSITLLPAPGNVQVTSVTDNSIGLEWNAVNRASGYSVYRSDSENGIYSKVHSVTVDSTAFTDTGLDGFTTYYYKVSAISDNIECIRSSTASATTLLSAPSNVQVSAVTDVSVTLEWNDVFKATGYNVYRADSENGSYSKINSNTVTSTIFIDTGLSENTAYYYKIKAVSGSSESVQLNAVSGITLMPRPGDVRITTISNNSVGIAWNAVNGVSGYNVYRSGSKDEAYTKVNTSTLTGTAFTDTGINPYTAVYYYRVSAVAGGTEGMQSDPVSPGVTVTVSGLTAKLAWLQSNAQSNNLYVIEVDTDESIAPQTLSYSGKSNIGIILIGEGTIRTVYPSAPGRLFTVDSGVTLILDNNITLRGRTDNNSLVYINNSGTLIMNTGVKITGNTASDGGGVYVNSSGSFIMNGGEISGNTAASPGRGGGVYVNNSGSFIMNGGEISDNTAPYGGGVFMLNGTFTMNGGEISGNTTRGVSVSGGTFTMSNGKISGNTAESGGGVSVFGGGTFTMSGGEISGNTSPNPYVGGGVYVGNSSSFIMSGGVIYGNNAAASLRNTAISGAALYVFEGTAEYDSATAEYGRFIGTVFIKIGNLTTSNTTRRIVNGNLLTE